MNAIVVVNPNSDTEVTAHLDRGLAGLRFADGPPITCVTLADAPKGIQTAMDSAVVVDPLCRLVERHDNAAAAFVIACFGDPGIHAVREITRKPVVGIGEAGLTVALNLGDRIGIVTNLDTDIAGHHRQNRALGIGARVAGVRAVGIPVVGLGDEAPVELLQRAQDEVRARRHALTASIEPSCCSMGARTDVASGVSP